MSEADAATIRDLTRALEDEVRTREDGLEPMIKRLKEEVAGLQQEADGQRAARDAAEAENASLREALGRARAMGIKEAGGVIATSAHLTPATRELLLRRIRSLAPAPATARLVVCDNDPIPHDPAQNRDSVCKNPRPATTNATTNDDARRGHDA